MDGPINKKARKTQQTLGIMQCFRKIMKNISHKNQKHTLGAYATQKDYMCLWH